MDSNDRKPRSLRRVAVRLGLAIISAFAGLVAAEAGIRSFDPFGVAYYREVPRYFAEAIIPFLGPDGLPDSKGRIFQQSPGVDLEYVDFRFTTNQAGLRDSDPLAEVPLRAGPATPGEGAWTAERWLFLGDSVTLAWGVDDSESWIRKVEAQSVAADGRPMEALNAGHLMYETVQQLDLLRAIGPVLRPDVVSLCFISNDLEPTYDQFVKQVTDAAARAGAVRAAGPLTKASVALQKRFFGMAAVWRYLTEKSTIKQGHSSAIGPMRLYPSNWPRCEAALNGILATCTELGARFVLIDHSIPGLPDLPQWASAHDVDYVRVGFTPADYARGIVNSAVDAHANPLGNSIIAERVLSGLRGLGRLRQRP